MGYETDYGPAKAARVPKEITHPRVTEPPYPYNDPAAANVGKNVKKVR